MKVELRLNKKKKKKENSVNLKMSCIIGIWNHVTVCKQIIIDNLGAI